MQLVEHRTQLRRHDVRVLRCARRRQPGEREQMGPLVPVEHQRPRDRVEHLIGRVDVASLFEPGVPSHPHAGE